VRNETGMGTTNGTTFPVFVGWFKPCRKAVNKIMRGEREKFPKLLIPVRFWAGLLIGLSFNAWF